MGNAWLNAVQRSDAVDFAGFVEVNDDISRGQVNACNLDNRLISATLPAAASRH